MDTFTLSLRRPWIISAAGRNLLVRFSDRLEAVALALVFATAMVIIPIAGAVGTTVYESHTKLFAEQAQARHVVTATAIEDSTIVVTTHDHGDVSRVDVRWLINGVEHLGSVDSASEIRAGQRLDVWVDASGDQVAAPTPTWRAGIDAIFAGVGTLLIAMAAVGGVSLIVRWWLTHRRYSSWDREWQTMVGDGGGRTGSQT